MTTLTMAIQEEMMAVVTGRWISRAAPLAVLAPPPSLRCSQCLIVFMAESRAFIFEMSKREEESSLPERKLKRGRAILYHVWRVLT